MTARLRFVATIQGVKVSVAKGAYDNGTAYADLVLRIEAPKKPAKPVRHSWQEDNAEQRIRILSAKSDVTADDQRQLEEARKELAEEHARRAERHAEYTRQLREMGPQLMAYAQVTGLAAIFGGMPVTITLEPQMQDLLPGLDVMMLPAPVDDEDLGA